jgi:4-amino-4-deoxy-L-arabinose transferase-like glycosyltransferase
MKQLLIWIIISSLVAFIFSYRLLQVPLGLTADEGAFGLNAVLLSNTLRDENNRFLPFFVLSLNGTDWRQPVTQYYLAGFFKFFGASVFNLRFSSVVITIFSAITLYYLVKSLGSRLLAIGSFVLFLTVPLVMIQSHLGLDNIMPIPFTILWLLFISLHSKTSRPIFLILSGISLGIGFYSYKGMRAIVPIWCVLTSLYLLQNSILKNYKKVIMFAVGIAPFFLIMPMLEKAYAGAVFDRHGVATMSIYEFLLPFIGSFDPSFLFITGDATPWHSTGLHGMFLISTFPLFIIGIVQAFKKRSYWWLILSSLILAPALYGMVGSIHRASRLMAIIPQFSIISALGFEWLWHKKKLAAVFVTTLVIINYADFANFYWYKYPELSRQWFGNLSGYSDYELLGKKAKELGLKSYIDDQLAYGEGHSGRFF